MIQPRKTGNHHGMTEKLLIMSGEEFNIHIQLSSEALCLFDLILYVPLTIFQLNRDGSSWVEPVLS